MPVFDSSWLKAPVKDTFASSFYASRSCILYHSVKVKDKLTAPTFFRGAKGKIMEIYSTPDGELSYEILIRVSDLAYKARLPATLFDLT